MSERLDIQGDALADEIRRYLAVVDAFRAASCEPTWQPEPGASIDASVFDRLRRPVERSAH